MRFYNKAITFFDQVSYRRRPIRQGSRQRQVARPSVIDGASFPTLPGSHFLNWAGESYSLKIIIFFIVLLSLVFFGRLFYLQVFLGNYYTLLASQNRLRSAVVRGERGVIYSADGQLLARNSAGFRVLINLPKLEDNVSYDSVWKEIGSILNVNSDRIADRLEWALKQNQSQLILASAVPHEQVLRLEENIWKWPMLEIEIDPIRNYPLSEVSAHVLGYLGEISSQELENKRWFYYDLGDWVGKSGLEKVYDHYLHGLNGSRLFEARSDGLGISELSVDTGRAGFSLKTSLQPNLLEVSFNALKEQLSVSGGKGGVVVAQDVNTGRVLSLVSYPSFDPNIFSQLVDNKQYQELISDPGLPFFNRSVEGLYPPGSVFKLTVGSGILEEGVAKPDQVFVDSPGGISVGIYTFGDWKPEGHGLVTFTKAIAQSCDTYFYSFGGGYKGIHGLGVDGIKKWAGLYGYGSLSGVDLPGEVGGLLPDPAWKESALKESWYLGDTYHYSIGQGYMLATPLQVNNATVAIANGGNLLQPLIVESILYSPGEVKELITPNIIRKDFVSPQTLALIRQGMREAVLEGGTAYPLRDFSIECGAKTGTSEFGDPKDRTHAWFTAFCPFDKPEIAVTVLLESAGEGSSQAGPVVRKVMESYFGDRVSADY